MVYIVLCNNNNCSNYGNLVETMTVGEKIANEISNISVFFQEIKLYWE